MSDTSDIPFCLNYSQVKHPFLQAFQQYWEWHFADVYPANTELIVAVSGGVDSIVLAYVLDQLGFQFVIAHCNFHLRGEESNRDENFVRQYADNIGKPFICKSFDTIAFADECKLGIEAAARELRYAWFRQLAEERKKEKMLPIFVAHHANDNVETVLINFFRGCGIAGLHGIFPVKDGIYRPLLFAKRKNIISFALSQQLKWIEDSSNRDEKYTRNFLRHNIIPELTSAFPTIEQNILDNIGRFQEVETLYGEYITLLKTQLLCCVDCNWQINIEQLKKQKALSTIVYELFKKFGFHANQTNEILKLLDAETGAQLASDTHLIWKDRGSLIISEKETHADETMIWYEDSEKIILPDGSCIVRKNNIVDNISNTTVRLDKDALQFPLTVRHWQEGDFFYPYGMLGKKKLAKYFIDLKIPNPVKHKIWIVTSGDNIVWVVGYRADRRFTVKDTTKNSYNLSFSQTN